MWTLSGRVVCKNGRMKRLQALVCLLALAACSGNAMPRTAAPGTESAAATRPSPGRGYLSFRVEIPKRKPHRRGEPKYISPATESIALTVFNAAHQQVAQTNQNLTPGSNTVTIPLNAGAYSANIVTYDGVSQTGNRLSETDAFPFSIAKGVANGISVVLDGVVASAVVIADPSAPFLGGSQSAGFQLAGMQAQVIDAYGRDADGNLILGAGAPTVGLASNSSNLVVAATGSKNPNQFTVRRASFQSTPVTLTATVTPASGGTAVVTTPSLQMVPLTYVYKSQGVGEYVPWSSTPALTIASSLSGTLQSGFFTQQNGVLQLDASGNIYILDYAGAQVVVYAPGATTPLRTISAGITPQPPTIAMDSTGTLYVANQTADTITEYAPGSTTVERTITSGISGPVAMALDASNTLYVMNIASSAITEYAHGSSSVLRSVTSGVGDPYGIAIDGFGNLYVGNGDSGGNNTVTVYTSGSTSVAHSLLVGTSTYGSYAFLGGLAVDAAGDVCVAAPPGELVCGSVAEGGFVGHVTGFPNTANFSSAMAFDAGGQFYVANLQPSPAFVRVYPPFAQAGFTPNMVPLAVIAGSQSAYGIAIQR
jgi:hypothetical protein